MKRIKQFSIFIFLIIISFFLYVEMVNRNSINMTYRQKLLKAIYPAWMWWTKLTGKNTQDYSGTVEPPVSFYSLKAVLNNGDTLDFASLQGKNILLVNTASDCGYTEQYHDLQKLADAYKDKLVILGFPANDFKQQEKGTDEQIAAFCKENFNVSFPLMKKSVVVQAADQNPVFQWLTDPFKNGWNAKFPSWNFSKYLVSEKGMLIKYFGPSVQPLSEEVKNSIKP
jgi:glutathione peroxidase